MSRNFSVSVLVLALALSGACGGDDEECPAGQMLVGGACIDSPDGGPTDAGTDTSTDSSTDSSPDGGEGVEVCDGLDNDGDGSVDEALTRACGMSEIGACTLGSEVCIDGEWTGCDAVLPVEEVCEGSVDENCDGQVDEMCPCEPGETRVCGSDVGVCTMGTQTCGDDGFFGACDGTLPSDAEACDGLDNDCDGTTDEDVPPTPCGTDEGECSMGIEVCVDGALECQGAVEASEEICDGLDNDCDGVVDPVGDNFCALGSGTTECRTVCGSTGTGTCTDMCMIAAPMDCTPPAESCTYDDDDCDGAIDEGLRVFSARPSGTVPVRASNPPRIVRGQHWSYVVGVRSGNLIVQRLDETGVPAGPIVTANDSGTVNSFDVSIVPGSLLRSTPTRLALAWVSGGRARLRTFETNDSGNFVPATAAIAPAATENSTDTVGVILRDSEIYLAVSPAGSHEVSLRKFDLDLVATEYLAVNPAGIGSGGTHPKLRMIGTTLYLIGEVSGVPVLYSVAPDLSSATLVANFFGGVLTFGPEVRSASSHEGALFVNAAGGDQVSGTYVSNGGDVQYLTLYEGAIDDGQVTTYYDDGDFHVVYLDGHDLWHGIYDPATNAFADQENWGRFAYADTVDVLATGQADWFLFGDSTTAVAQRHGCF